MALVLSFANAAQADAPTLHLPVDCELGGDRCYIQQYKDRQPGAGWRDYQCSTLSYDGHSGTDFAVVNRKVMRQGVNVIAAASGTVRGIRDGMPDTGWTAETAPLVGGRPCGNGLVIDHSGGWSTQYCHLKEGSVQVEKGQTVTTGTVLGQIGQSGRAEFPHVHFTVRKHDVAIDPFDPDGVVNCGTPGDSTLWAETPIYQPGGLIEVGMATHIPSYAEVKEGTVARSEAPQDAPSIVIYGFTFGTRQGDVLQLMLQAPNGNQIAFDEATFDGNHAQAFRAIGKRLTPGRQWQQGTYIGTVTLKRADNVISQRKAEMVVN